MSALGTVVRLAEESGVTEGSQTSPYVFGGTAAAVLVLLLIITLLLNVNR